jgi:hypothetical protein
MTGGLGMTKANGAGGREQDVVRIIRRNKFKLDTIRSTFTPPSMLSLSNASEEITKALRIPQDAATATLYGLCAIGRIRWVDFDGKLVNCDEVTVSNFGGKPAFVVAEDVHDVVAEWSPDPVSSNAKQAVVRRLLAKHNPPRTISWKEFCNLVRDHGHGWFESLVRRSFTAASVLAIRVSFLERTSSRCSGTTCATA